MSSKSDKYFASTVFVALLALVVSFVAVGASVVAVNDSGGGGDSEAAVATGEPLTIEVSLGEMFVEPSSIEIPAGTHLTMVVTNDGVMPHDLQLADGTGTPMLDPGETVEASFGVITESMEAWCTVPGHKDAGMVMSIEVTGSAPAAALASEDHGGGTSGGDNATIDFNAAPDDDWKPFDPKLEPAPGGTNHELTWSMTEEVVEIAPGVTQEVWVFDGQVPGPTLRGKVGDIFTVTIVNDGEIGHSLDFHASKVAWNDEMRTIAPGESLVYQFEAKHSGIFMYHCGTAPALHHIGNGMHGAIVIDPPDLAPVDHEFIFVQHEYYLGPDGEPGDLGKMQRDEWDAVVFNGYVNQYLHAPIRVETGERIRAWVLDNGPSENSSFHVVGTVFDTTYKEGTYLLRPDGGQGGAQALDLQPAQGGFVEFTFDEDGLYPIVTHKFSNVGKGALGLFQAGEVESAGGGH
jgi:nitrite reductase (NO-forming)